MRALIVLAIIVLAATKTCDVSDIFKADCGYLGINQ